MKTDRESARAEAPTIVLMIALLVCVVCLIANAVGDAPLEVVATEDQLEVPPSQAMDPIADVRDTVDADVPAARAVPAVERSASNPSPSVLH